MIDIKKTISRIKVRQARGGSWVQIIFNLGIITANVALFKDWFASIGLSEVTAILILCPVYLISTEIIGYLDERYGIWQNENEFNTSLNPFMRNIRDKVEILYKKYEEENK